MGRNQSTALGSSEGSFKSRTAVLFPGHGSPYPDMGKELYLNFSVFRKAFEEANEFLKPRIGKTIEDLIFTDRSSSNQVKENLRRTDWVQPVILAVDTAYYRWLLEQGIQVDVLLGHSVGEFPALVAAGVLAFEAALYLMLERGRIFRRLQETGMDTGGMVAVLASAKPVRDVVGEGPIAVAARNHPEQTVISGPVDSLMQALKSFTKKGIAAKALDVTVAWHSTLAENLGGTRARELFDEVSYGGAAKPVLCNVDLEYYDGTVSSDRTASNLAKQFGLGMDFVQCVEKLYRDGVRTFVETGPRKILTGFVSKILRDQPHEVYWTDTPNLGLCGVGKK